MTAPKHRFRTLSGKGETTDHATEDECRAKARTVAVETGDWCGIEQWDESHPQDTLNGGWVMIGSVEPNGTEVQPDPSRVALAAVTPGDTITVFAHRPRFNPAREKDGGDVTGTVRAILPCKYGEFNTYVISFGRGDTVEALADAVCSYAEAETTADPPTPEATA